MERAKLYMAGGKVLSGGSGVNLLREEGRMWVFTRPRSGQEYNLLMSETRGGPRFCPIHRFDRLNQISGFSFETVHGWRRQTIFCLKFSGELICKSKYAHSRRSSGNNFRISMLGWIEPCIFPRRRRAR